MTANINANLTSIYRKLAVSLEIEEAVSLETEESKKKDVIVITIIKKFQQDVNQILKCDTKSADFKSLLNYVAITALNASQSKKGMKHVISLALRNTVSTNSPMELVKTFISSLSAVAILSGGLTSTPEIPTGQSARRMMTSYSSNTTPFMEIEGLLDIAALKLTTQDVTTDTARKQYMELEEILRFVQMVKINNKNVNEAVKKEDVSLSLQDHDAIIQKLQAKMEMIMSKAKAGARSVMPEIPFDQLSTVQDIVSAIENLFGNQNLCSAVKQKLAKDGFDKTKFINLIRDFVHLADEAIHAPDYAKTQNGRFHPVSRAGYRDRDHDSFTLWSSAVRQEASKETLGKRFLKAINNEQPVDAMEQLIRNSFIEEVGLDTANVQDWTVDTIAVQKAICANLLLPLRALNETKQNLNKGEKELDPVIHKVVTDITRAVLEGRFREWRYENSKHQLSGLSEKQLEIWKSGTTAELCDLKTREEDDLGLFWVTKVGGPSHGFDQNGNCLLPLLCNSRTKAIMINDSRYPDTPAARSYLRLLHRKDGSPELFLEPFQRDFPHIEIFGDALEVDNVYYANIMIHAIKKAGQMGLPLTIHVYYGEIAKALNFSFELRKAKLLLKKSSGIFEASDTLSSKHDWVQMQDELTEPLYRLVHSPES